MASTTTKFHSQPVDVAALALALIDSAEYSALQSIASVFVMERVLAMDSVTIEDKLPIYVWGSRSAAEFESLATSIRNFVVSGAAPPQPIFKKLDGETVLAAIQFGSDQRSHLPSPSASPSKHGDTLDPPFVILLKATDSWAYHDIRCLDGRELAKWYPSLQLAQENWVDSADTRSVVSLSAEDLAYWDSYLSEAKATGPLDQNLKPKDQEYNDDDSDDDYWNAYDNTASRF
ncbi:hypothetical protein HDU79_007976 [Rhizoclosmatium sp. JEL0117]|nr:hypothetical protein HDU79_007976 [Rhizoclosmatium sp. JEL0117]